MKTGIFVCFCIASALAAPSILPEYKVASTALRSLPALVHEEVHDKMGQYTLRYVTAEGTEVMETGELEPTPDGKGLVLTTKGQVKYIGDDGKTYITRYSAGLDGYKVEGDHLPQAPKVPVVPEVHPVQPDQSAPAV